VDLLNALVNATGSGDLQKLGAQFGLDNEAVGNILGQVVPALGDGLKKNAASSGGLESLIGALQNGNHQRYLESVDSAISSTGISEGNSILGHILGSKDASRAVASRASSASGVNPDVIKQMLPMLATLFMGTLNKQTDGGAKLQAGGDNPLGGLAAMFDSDGDGSVVDDALDLAKKFF